MGTFDYLVNNIPSYAVCKERLALAKDQLNASEKEMAQLRAEVAQLTAERDELKARIEAYEAKEQVGQGAVLPIEIKLLRLIADIHPPLSDQASAPSLAARLGLPVHEAEYHLEAMTKRGLLYDRLSSNRPVRYSLKQPGRAALMQNKVA